MRFSYFVSAHGFGHAARSAAVMEAIAERLPASSFEIVTTVPKWFFAQSLTAPHSVRRIGCDVGFVQIDPVLEDLAATVSALERFWRSLSETAGAIVESWTASPPSVVVSDISPLGLEAARLSGTRSVLIENFTWDWIYDAYAGSAPGLARYARLYERLLEGADHHIQCEPWCRPAPGAIRVGPVSRRPRFDRQETRRALGLDDDPRPLVLLTMGGMGWNRGAPRLGGGCVFVTLGGSRALVRERDLIRLPDRSPVYPPDLVAAADAVVGKLGYSTVVECFRSGTPLGFIRRPRFPESAVLERFVLERLPAIPIEGDELTEGDLDRLLELPRERATESDGAQEIGELLSSVASSG